MAEPFPSFMLDKREMRPKQGNLAFIAEVKARDR
jgi:hypothetical protein